MGAVVEWPADRPGFAGEGARVRVHLDARKMWQTKDVWAASVDQGKRYAERWCAARLYPEMRLRAAVARMVDGSPAEPLPPLPGLPPTPEQLQQARRLAEAGEGAGAGQGSAGANPPAGGKEAQGEGPAEDAGEGGAAGPAARGLR
ncbi:hypothetical protein SNK04_013968 [Fusarium graminearum]